VCACVYVYMYIYVYMRAYSLDFGDIKPYDFFFLTVNILFYCVEGRSYCVARVTGYVFIVLQPLTNSGSVSCLLSPISHRLHYARQVSTKYRRNMR
jgi:hypothetical protein